MRIMKHSFVIHVAIVVSVLTWGCVSERENFQPALPASLARVVDDWHNTTGTGREFLPKVQLSDCKEEAVLSLDNSSVALPDSNAPATSAPSGKPIAIANGLWTFETYGSYASQPKGTREQLYSGTIGVGYNFVFSKFSNSVTLEATGLQATQAGPDVGSGGGDLLLRTHLINEPGWTAFIDFGPGVLESSGRLPAAGTYFNFFFKTGAGAAVHLWDGTDLLVGARLLHISNARIDSAARNPSINTIEGYLGLLFKL
ncbi:MAG: acyloxyacyl hydrolase [Tepidisphaeraceae bacterium]